MATTKSGKRRMSKAERQQAREAAQAKAQAALDRLGEGVRAVYDSERWETQSACSLSSVEISQIKVSTFALSNTSPSTTRALP